MYWKILNTKMSYTWLYKHCQLSLHLCLWCLILINPLSSIWLIQLTIPTLTHFLLLSKNNIFLTFLPYLSDLSSSVSSAALPLSPSWPESPSLLWTPSCIQSIYMQILSRPLCPALWPSPRTLDSYPAAYWQAYISTRMSVITSLLFHSTCHFLTSQD